MVKLPNMFRNYKFKIAVGLVVYCLLNWHFDKIYIPGNWEFGSGSILMNASPGHGDMYMGTHKNGSLYVFRSNFFVEHFQSYREWPGNLTETCDDNEVIRMVFSKYGPNLDHGRNIVKNENFTTKFSFKESNFNKNDSDHFGYNKFEIESTYQSNEAMGPLTQSVDLCDPDHYFISHFMFGLVNYDKLAISIWNPGYTIKGFYRIADYDISKITKSDMIVVEKMLTVPVIE